MNVPALGQLRLHPDAPEEWLISAPLPIPYLDGVKFPIILDGLGESDEQDVAAAIVAFLRLGPADRDSASSYIYKNYQRILAVADEEDLGCRITSHADVWEHVHPTDIYVSRRPRRDRAIYVSIMANCDWEPEHGLQIIYRRGAELSRVSQFDGHLTHADAYDLAEDQDKIA